MQPRYLTGTTGGCLLSAVYLTVWEQIGVARPMSSHPTESEAAINVVLGREAEGWPHVDLNCFVTFRSGKAQRILDWGAGGGVRKEWRTWLQPPTVPFLGFD